MTAHLSTNRGVRLLVVAGTAVALVIGLDSLTYASTGNSLILGRTNLADNVTIIDRTTDGPAASFRVANPNVAAPFTVVGNGKVVNLFADKAANALLLGGKTIDGIAAQAPAGNAGPRGVQGPTGDDGVTSVLNVRAGAVTLPAPPGTGQPLPSPTMLASTPVTITSFNQRLTGTTQITMSTPGITKNQVLFGLCTQRFTTTPVVSVSAATFWSNPAQLDSANALLVQVSGEDQQTFTGTTFGLAPGTYNVGPCALDVSGSASSVNVSSSNAVAYVSPS